MKYYEVNFDGLIGPTHNYAGLAKGNLASAKHAQHVSRPKKAALEGLEKMLLLWKQGYQQGFLLPQQRPRVDILRRLGFGNAQASDKQVINIVAKQDPQLLAQVYSASPMWAANAATVCPSQDSDDGKVHFTPANLLTTMHRCIEHTETYTCLNTVFNNSHYFTVHEALPSHANYADEGAANHTRLCHTYDSPGAGLFVYGKKSSLVDAKYPLRQTQLASETIARQHGMTNNAYFLSQNIEAINAGAFHNDVVAVGNGPVLFFHQDTFSPQEQQNVFSKLEEKLPLLTIEVPRDKVSLEDAISSYLFNSQLLASPDGDMDAMQLIAPTECKETPSVKQYLDELVKDRRQPIRHVEYVNVRQSMSNGGGPACLRLRVLLSEEELAAVNPTFLLNEETATILRRWINTYYRDEIKPADLADPSLLDESYLALDALTQYLNLGSYYAFQK